MLKNGISIARFVALVVWSQVAIGVNWAAAADERFKVVRIFEAPDFPGGLEFATVLPEQNVVLATQWAPERFSYIAWDMTTGKTRFTMPTKTPPQSLAFFYKLDFSSPPDGTWFALPRQRFEDPSDVSLVAISDGSIIRQLADSESGSITGLVVFENGRAVIGGCSKGKVRIWDAGTGKLKHTLAAHDKPVYTIAIDETSFLLATHVAISPDGKLIAAQSFSNFDVTGRNIETANAEVDQDAKEIVCRVDFFFGSQFGQTASLSIPCKNIEESPIGTMNGLRFSHDGKFLTVATGASVALISVAAGEKSGTR